MKIGAFNKFSAIDYPDGLLACVLGCQGCNLRCGWCHNGQMVGASKPSRDLIPEKDIFTFLRRRSQQLDAVVITGGEPSLQADLPDFCRQVKTLGFKIKLDTNGSRPEMVAKLIDNQLIDYVAMDIKTAPQEYHQLSVERNIDTSILHSIRIIMRQAPAYEFRTTCVRPFVTEQTVLSIGRLIEGASRYFLQKCRPEAVLDPRFFSVNPPPQSDPEIEALKALVAPLVADCQIR